jgi:protein tyrosine/serine phosphatase
MINSDNLHNALNADIKTPIPESIVSKIISLPPFITVSGVSNFRDLSYENNLCPGYVYRSANLSDITEEGKVMFTADLGITTIFDLRNESERTKAPPPQIEGIDTIWMPYGTRPASLNLRDFAGEDKGANGFVKMYTGILEACAPAFAQVFKHIRDQPDDPFVFHCSGTFVLRFPSIHTVAFATLFDWTFADQCILFPTAGKDRSGVLAALILLLMGRPLNEIINDYMLTRAGLENVRENLTQALALNEGTGHLSPEAIGMLELSGVRAQAMAAFLKSFHSTYGSGAEGYLTTKLGFSHDDIKLMRRSLAA